MRLLVPSRICIALRKATISPVSTRAPNQSRNPIAASATEAKSLQELFELSKLSDEINLIDVEKLKTNGRLNVKSAEHRVTVLVRRLSDHNDFSSIEKLLGVYDHFLQEKAKAVDSSSSKFYSRTSNVKVVGEVLWFAALAKSLHSLPPSILEWIEQAIRSLPEPNPNHKESMIWLLSIIRGDLPMLLQLQKESIRKRGIVGPEFKREKTLRYVAVNYLDVGNEEDFRSLWTSSGTSILGADDLTRNMSHGDDNPRKSGIPRSEADMISRMQHRAALLHHALLRNAKNGKPDSAMLRWYAESLVEDQRTPIAMNPQFEMMMKPVIRALGGKIETWKIGDKREEKLRKWRDGYSELERENLVQSLLDYMRFRIKLGHGHFNDLSRLEKLLSRLVRNNERRRTVVVDWVNLSRNLSCRNSDIIIRKFLPSCSLIIVGLQRITDTITDEKDDSAFSPRLPAENGRIKVMEVMGSQHKSMELDDVCLMILAVATCGHWMSNDLLRPDVDGFRQYLERNSMDINQSILLKNYLNDSVMRIGGYEAQPLVDHSRAAQWIDKEKKELAFTVARVPAELDSDQIYRLIDYYSLRLD